MAPGNMSISPKSVCPEPGLDILDLYFVQKFIRIGNLEPFSISRCCLTSIGIPIIKIRRSWDRLVFKMGISLYIETGHWLCSTSHSHRIMALSFRCRRFRDHEAVRACKQHSTTDTSTVTCWGAEVCELWRWEVVLWTGSTQIWPL